MPGTRGEHDLQERFGTSARARAFYDHQVLDHLSERMRVFIARMDMVFVATADGSGNADCSFRAGPPGFVEVLDDRTLVYPEYRGNGVMSSLGNISENRQIGMLFVDFCGDAVGLHVNGGATILAGEQAPPVSPASDRGVDGPLQDAARRPEHWVRVDVAEAFIHCSRHIPLMARLPDDRVRAGGDYFGVKHLSRPWVDDEAAPRPRNGTAH